MASKTVEDAVDAYLAANWTASPVLSENEQQEAPEDGTPFLLVQYPVANTRRVATGTPSYLEEGGFRILINVERGAGTDKIREWGEDLVALFRDVVIPGTDIHCLVPTEPYTDDQSDQGNYFAGSLVVQYLFSYSA